MKGYSLKSLLMKKLAELAKLSKMKTEYCLQSLIIPLMNPKSIQRKAISEFV